MVRGQRRILVAFLMFHAYPYNSLVVDKPSLLGTMCLVDTPCALRNYSIRPNSVNPLCQCTIELPIMHLLPLLDMPQPNKQVLRGLARAYQRPSRGRGGISSSSYIRRTVQNTHLPMRLPIEIVVMQRYDIIFDMSLMILGLDRIMRNNNVWGCPQEELTSEEYPTRGLSCCSRSRLSVSETGASLSNPSFLLP